MARGSSYRFEFLAEHGKDIARLIRETGLASPSEFIRVSTACLGRLQDEANEENYVRILAGQA